MEQPDELSQLAEGGQVSLASWLGTPLNRTQAQMLLTTAQQRLCSGRPAGAERFSLRLAELIGRYWAGHDIEAAYQTMSPLLTDGRERALLELCLGQLLMARRCQSAWQHLDRGFQLAAHLLEAEDYFRVLRRHELLRQLPLASIPADAATLDALLNEARVIARLRGTGKYQHSATGASQHRDTID